MATVTKIMSEGGTADSGGSSKGTGKITLEEIKEHSGVADDWGWDDSIDDEGQIEFIEKEANKIKLGGKDERIKQAIQSSKTHYFGDEDGNLKADWRGVSSIKTKGDVKLFNQVIDTFDLEDKRITSVAGIYMLNGKYRDGEEMPTVFLKSEDINAIMKQKKYDIEEKKNKEVLLKTKIKMQESYKYDHEGTKAQGLQLVKVIAENTTDEEEKSRLSKAWDFLINEATDLYKVKDAYNKAINNPEAKDAYIEYLESDEGKAGVAEYHVERDSFLEEAFKYLPSNEFWRFSEIVEEAATKADEAYKKADKANKKEESTEKAESTEDSFSLLDLFSTKLSASDITGPVTSTDGTAPVVAPPQDEIIYSEKDKLSATNQYVKNKDKVPKEYRDFMDEEIKNGKEPIQAMKELQRHLGLSGNEVDGIVGKNTLDIMNKKTGISTGGTLPTQTITNATSVVGRTQQSLIGSEGENIHIDTANILTLGGGVIPQGMEIKNPKSDKWEDINARDIPKWITNKNIESLSVDMTDVNRVVDGKTIKYATNPPAFNERVLTAFDAEATKKIKDYSAMTPAVQAALLTNAWNGGINMLTYSGFTTAINYLKNNTVDGSALTTEDKISLLKPSSKHNVSEGKMYAALIHRRAEVYNAVASSNKIDGIKVTKDEEEVFTIHYYSGNTELIAIPSAATEYGNALGKLYNYNTTN